MYTAVPEARSVSTIQPCTSLQCHSLRSHIRRVHVCLVVTCHVHFWQNDRDLLRATAATRGWNGSRNKSQHKKLTLEKKILPPLASVSVHTLHRQTPWAISVPDFSLRVPVYQTFHLGYQCTRLSTWDISVPDFPLWVLVYQTFHSGY